VSRLTLTAAVAATYCQSIAVDAARAAAPSARYWHPVEIAIGTILSLPPMPADIPAHPHPLWLGWRFTPPKRLGLPASHGERLHRREVLELAPPLTLVEGRLLREEPAHAQALAQGGG
jgi:hypothetical protein